MNQHELGQLIDNEARITASRNDGNIFTRKLLRFDSSENLANQPAVAEDGAGTHRLYSRFTDGMTRLFQRQRRQQRRPVVQKICHRFESRRNHAADVAAPLRNDIESHRCAEVRHDGRTSIEFGNSCDVCQAIRAYRFGFRIINRNTQLQFRIQPEDLRFIVRSFRDRRVFCRRD